jgi:hypothetical protein
MKLHIVVMLAAMLALAVRATRPDASIEPGVALSGFRFFEVASSQNETGDPGNDQAAVTFHDDLVDAPQSAGVNLSDTGPSSATLLVKPALVHYEAGAVARWILPGSGCAQATVAVGLVNKSGGESIGDLAATDQVSTAGLLSIGQDRLILSRLGKGNSP